MTKKLFKGFLAVPVMGQPSKIDIIMVGVIGVSTVGVKWFQEEKYLPLPEQQRNQQFLNPQSHCQSFEERMPKNTVWKNA